MLYLQNQLITVRLVDDKTSLASTSTSVSTAKEGFEAV